MAPAIGIKAYNLRNSGIAIIIYPQLRKSSNPEDTYWDGRDHSGYSIGINSDITVDLKDTGLGKDSKFFLSENTHWGQDMWDSSQEFFYDPSSTFTAYATRWGGARDGSLSYQGVKSSGLAVRMPDLRPELLLADQFEAYAASVTHETIRELFDAAFRADANAAFPWKGLARWGPGLNPKLAVLAVAAITAALVSRGYAFTFHTREAADQSKTTTVLFGPRQLMGGSAAPAKVRADWIAAVAAARRYSPIDLGVFPNTGKLSDLEDPSSDAVIV